MDGRRFAALVALLAIALSASAAEQTGAKRDLVVFALGSALSAVPSEALASADAAIIEVFVNLGRFNVIGRPERLSSADARILIRELERAGIRGALVVIPTVTGCRTGYNEARNQYETAARTSVAVLDVAEGIAVADFDIETEGRSDESEDKAIRSALADIAVQLEAELRSIPAFIRSAQVLHVGGGRVKLRLGAKEGVKRGDEYALVESARGADGAEEAEIALILVERVEGDVSAGRILYGGNAMAEGARLREIPRLGLDVAPYGRYLRYFRTLEGADGAFVGGVKFVPTRGFFAFKPLFGFQATADRDRWFPIAGFLGVQYDRYRGRLTLSANAAVGGATNLVYAAVKDQVEGATESGADAPFLSHCGFLANVGVGFLVLRDLRLFAEAGIEYWLSLPGDDSLPFSGYGGVGATVGAIVKL